MNILDALIVLAYLASIMIYGIYSGRRLKSMHDFTNSTKKYGTMVMFGTLCASFIGGGFSSGNAAQVFQFGVGNIVGLWGFGIGQILIGKFIAPRASTFTQSRSPGDIMKTAYGVGAKITTGVCSFLLSTGLLAAQLAAIGLMFNLLLGMDYVLGLLLGLLVVLVYSTIGGLGAIIVIDVVQFILLIVAVPMLLIFCVTYAGGPEQIIASVPPGFLNPLNNTNMLGLISLMVTLMVGEALTPVYVQRMLLGRRPNTVSRATIFSGILAIPFFAISGLVGLAALAIEPGLFPGHAMPAMILTVMPPVLKGVCIAAMLSIVMSSADSVISSATVGFTEDIATPLRPSMTRGKNGLRLARIVNVCTGLLGAALAISIPDVFGVLLFAYTFWCPVVLVPLVGAIMKTGAPKSAFITGGISGALTTVIWGGVLQNPFGLGGTVAGFAVNLLLFTLVTLAFKRKRRYSAPLRG